VEHVEHDEPDGRGLAEAAEERRESGAEHHGEVVPERLGAKHPEPDHRKNDEIHPCHGGGGEHGTRHVAVRINGLADVAGGCLEGRSGKPDQIETGHDRGEIAEPAFEGRSQMIVEGFSPIHVACDHGSERRNEGERRRGRGYGDGEASDPFDAAQIHEAEKADDGDGHSFDRKPGEIPMLEG
jgi:hypothetical protein